MSTKFTLKFTSYRAPPHVHTAMDVHFELDEVEWAMLMGGELGILVHRFNEALAAARQDDQFAVLMELSAHLLKPPQQPVDDRGGALGR